MVIWMILQKVSDTLCYDSFGWTIMMLYIRGKVGIDIRMIKEII